jgi:DNA-binding transcriptional ArsR family regulator
MQFHAHSLFGDGPRRPLTIGERALWLARLDAARRARHITPAHELVARALLKRLGPDGRLDPAQDTLAHDTGLSDRTVRRALRALADAGLLTWQRRLVRDGWRCRQTSNAYCLVPEGLPIPPLDRERGRKAGEAGEKKREKFITGSTAGLSAAASPALPRPAVRPAYLSGVQLAVLRAGLVRP